MTRDTVERITRRVAERFACVCDGEHGACHEAALVLGLLLAQQGVATEIVYGRYRVAYKRDHATGQPIASELAHTWLTAPGLILDPTRRQFYPPGIAARTPLTVNAADQAADTYTPEKTEPPARPDNSTLEQLLSQRDRTDPAWAWQLRRACATLLDREDTDTASAEQGGSSS